MLSVAGKAGKKSKKNLFWKKRPTKAGGGANEAKNFEPCREDAAQRVMPHVVVSGMISLSGDAPQSPTGPETSGRADPSAMLVGIPPAETRTETNEVVADAPDGPSCKVPDKIVMPGVVSGMSIPPGDVQSSSTDAAGGSDTPTPRSPCGLSEISSTEVFEVREGSLPTLEVSSSSPPEADQDKSPPSESVPAAEVTIGSGRGVVVADASGTSSVEKKMPKTNSIASGANVLPEDPEDASRPPMAGDASVACVANNLPTPNVGGSPRVSASPPSTLSVDGSHVSGSAPTLSGNTDMSASTVGGVGTASRVGTESPSTIVSTAGVVVAGAPDMPSTDTKKPKRGMLSVIFRSSKGKIECEPAGAVPSSKGPEKLSLAPKKPSFDNISRSSKLDTKGLRPKGRYVVVSGMKDTSDENDARLAQSSSEKATEINSDPEAGESLLGQQKEVRSPNASGSSPIVREPPPVSSGSQGKPLLDTASE